MATRIKGEGRSIQGELYEVYLDDGTPGTPIVTVPIAENGLQINYKANEDGITDANLLLSTCTITFYIQNVTQRTQLNFLTVGDESDNKVRVFKNGSLFWAGNIQAELASEEDKYYPQQYSLTATDGIARLKSIDYDFGSTGSDEYQTILKHIENVLTLSPSIGYYAANDEFLRVHTTLWPDELTPNTTDNPLANLRVSSKVFRRVDRSGVVEYLSCYDALLNICKTFGLKFFYANGGYVLVEIVAFDRQDGELRWHRYDKNFTELSQEVLTDWTTWQINVGDDIAPTDSAKMLSGGIIEYQPPVKKVEYTYKHFSKRNMLPGFSWDNDNTPTATVNNFRSGGGTVLKITGQMTNSVTPPVLQDFPAVPVNVVIGMSLWVDPNSGGSSQAVTRTYNYSGGSVNYNPQEWVSGGIEIKLPIVSSIVFENQNTVDQFSIITPPVPIDGSLNLSFDLEEVLLNGVTWFTANADFAIESVFVESLVGGIIDDQFNFRRISVENPNFADNTVVEEREIIIADGTNINSFGRIEAKTGPGANDWDLTTNWRHFAEGVSLSGTSEILLKVLAKDLLTIYASRRAEIDGAFIGRNYNAGFALVRDSKVYTALRAQFNLLRDEVRGRFTQVSRVEIINEPTVIVDIETDPNGSPFDQPTDQPINPPQGGTVTLGPAQLGVNTSIALLDDDIVGGTTYTLIDIDVAAADLPLIQGTQLIITHPYTGATQTVTLSADYLEGVANPWITPSGDTWTTPGGSSWIIDASPGLAIESILIDNDFPAGSYVQVLDQSQVQLTATMSEAYELFTIYDLATTLTTGTSDEFWRPVDQVGWRLKGVTIALGDNPNTSTVEIAIRHKDNSGTITTVATYVGDSLTFSGPLDTEVLDGYYYPDVIAAGTGVLGLQVAYKIRKTL